MIDKFRPFSKDPSFGNPEQDARRRLAGANRVGKGKAERDPALKKEIERKWEIIKEKQLSERDSISDGKFSGSILRIEPNGDVVVWRGGGEKIYHPEFVTKIPRPQK